MISDRTGVVFALVTVFGPPSTNSDRVFRKFLPQTRPLCVAETVRRSYEESSASHIGDRRYWVSEGSRAPGRFPLHRRKFGRCDCGHRSRAPDDLRSVSWRPRRARRGIPGGPRRRIALLVATYHAVPAALRRLRPDREGAARRAAGDPAQTWFRWPDRDGDRRGLEGAAALRISGWGSPGSRADGGPAASAEGRQ